MAFRFYVFILLLLHILHSHAVLSPRTGTPVHDWDQCPTGCSCMGESMQCQTWNMESIPLPIPKSITIVTLARFPFTKINETFFYKTPELQWLQITRSSLLEFPKLPKLLRLSYLDLSHNGIEHLPAKSFVRTPYVTQLNLSNNAIETFDNRFFEGLTNLRILDLSHNNFISPPSKLFFRHISTLNYLDLSFTNLKDSPLEWVNQLSFLYSLNLSHNRIASLYSMINSVLGVLDVSFNPLKEMPSLSRLPGLLEFSASHTELSKLEPAQFSQCNHLKMLDLSNSNLSYVSGGIFKKCDQLRVLKLNDNYNLTGAQHTALEGLTELAFLDMSNCPKLHELESKIFSYTPSLNQFYLTNTGLQVLPSSLTLLGNLTTFNAINTTLLCDCHARWLPEWLAKVDHSVWEGLDPVMCHGHGPTDASKLKDLISSQECEETAIFVPEKWITLKSADETATLHCNVTGHPLPKILWMAPNKQLYVHNKTDHNNWVSHRINSALDRSHDLQGGKFEVLEGGEMLVHNLSREDIGRYRCFAYNDVSNASVEMFLGIKDDEFRALIIQSHIFGFCCAALFLLVTLIVQFIRYLMDRFGWECCCCKNRISSRANQIKQLLESVELYKSAQLEKLRENYTSQVNYIKDSCYSQMEKVRDSYAHQSKNLKDLCDYSTQQFTGAKDQYLDQVNKIRDYSTGQINRVRENYVFQRQRIRKFSAHQLLRLRETYKYQQKTLNKLLETLPDLYIQNCRTGVCQRTDSILFDELDGLDVYYKVDFLDTQSTSSDYYTPSSTLTRPPKNKHHSRNPSNTSGTTVYQDMASRQNIAEKDAAPHNRYHSRSYSLVPQHIQSEIIRGHKRSSSATQTTGVPTEFVPPEVRLETPSPPETPAADQDGTERCEPDCDSDGQNRSRKPSYETSL